MTGAGQRPARDLALYLVTDPLMTARRGLAATVEAAVRGGVTAVQLRDKESSPRDLAACARALLALLRPLGVPLLVNDDVEVAALTGADGVHVGQGDLAPPAARARIGPRALLGLSVTCAGDLTTVDPDVVDYVGLGPVFATGTKPDAAPALGLEGFADVRRRLPGSMPVVAIGGIGLSNAASVVAAGADGVSVVSAICAAEDPGAASRALAAEVRRALAARAASAPPQAW